MAFGPQAGLELVDALASEPSLKSYHLLPERARRTPEQTWPLGRGPGGVREPQRSLIMSRERTLLLERARLCVVQAAAKSDFQVPQG